jgi:hypothetical protein
MRTIGLTIKTDSVKQTPKNSENNGAKKTKSENKKKCNSTNNPTP